MQSLYHCLLGIGMHGLYKSTLYIENVVHPLYYSHQGFSSTHVCTVCWSDLPPWGSNNTIICACTLRSPGRKYKKYFTHVQTEKKGGGKTQFETWPRGPKKPRPPPSPQAQIPLLIADPSRGGEIPPNKNPTELVSPSKYPFLPFWGGGRGGLG